MTSEIGTHQIGTSARPDHDLAVVVGAGGMGMVAARRLAQRYRILLVDVDGARAGSGAESLRAEGGDATSLACDITDPDAVAGLAEAVEQGGGLRVLAHVAGLSPSMGDFAGIVTVNLHGAALVADRLRPLARVGAAAVLISSVAGHGITPGPEVEALLAAPLEADLATRLAAALGPDRVDPGTAYQLSKYGLLTYCRREAVAWGALGARIVTLSPGLIASPMGALEFARSPGKRAVYARTPLRREGTMLEIADALEFLVSDRASFVTGTDLLVDGGLAGALESSR